VRVRTTTFAARSVATLPFFPTKAAARLFHTVNPLPKRPRQGTGPINWRSETAATTGLFRGAFKVRLGIVPADTSYESPATEPSE
jgi:putative SOS response-associated peptidase YedK